MAMPGAIGPLRDHALRLRYVALLAVLGPLCCGEVHCVRGHGHCVRGGMATVLGGHGHCVRVQGHSTQRQVTVLGGQGHLVRGQGHS